MQWRANFIANAWSKFEIKAKLMKRGENVWEGRGIYRDTNIQTD